MKYDKFIYLFLIILTSILSCSKKDENEKLVSDTFIKKFYFEHIKSSEKKWDIKCDIAFLEQSKNVFKCNNTIINVYSNGRKISYMKANSGYGELDNNSFYLKGNVFIISYSQNIELYSQLIHFDSEKEFIYSDFDTRVINKKENVEVNSKGFEAKSDLSNIKFFKHTTKKL